MFHSHLYPTHATRHWQRRGYGAATARRDRRRGHIGAGVAHNRSRSVAEAVVHLVRSRRTRTNRLLVSLRTAVARLAHATSRRGSPAARASGDGACLRARVTRGPTDRFRFLCPSVGRVGRRAGTFGGFARLGLRREDLGTTLGHSGGDLPQRHQRKVEHLLREVRDAEFSRQPDETSGQVHAPR